MLCTGKKSEMATCGHSGYLTPAVSGVPNALHGDKIRNGPHVGLTRAVSAVPNALHGDKIRNDPHVGTVAT